MRRILWVLCALVWMSCSDVLPEKQCDPARRCAVEDTPVCGADGQWYECGLVADCEEVAVTTNTAVCADGPDDPSCPDLACDDCENLIETFDDDGCLIGCECPATTCPDVDLDCADIRRGPDGCPTCVDGCNTPSCEADGCELVYSPGERCPRCQCEPLDQCEPFDRGSCEANPNCSVDTDANGCSQCVCDTDECPREFCNNFCPNGYLIIDGCASCECYEPCLQLPECDLFCPTGNTQDPATGCQNSCECISEECAGVDCRLSCEFGFRRDGSGCEACECRGRPCTTSEQCGLDETCVMDPTPHDFGDGECVQLELCDANGNCADGGPCGFYFRQDCCPPLTTCTDDMLACAPVCLLDVGDLPRDAVTF